MRFELTVFSERDGVRFITLDAPTRDEAMQDAGRQGLTVLSMREPGGWRAIPSLKRSAFPLLQISQELLSLLRAGVNLVEAIETLVEKEQSADTRSVLDRILDELRAGKPLSAALEGFPQAFPALYVASVRASERTGDLTDALSRYVMYRLQVEELRKKIVSALVYPVLLLGVGGLVTMFLLAYVVPRFSRIFEDRGGDLPFLTKVLIQWGSFFDQHTGAVALALLAAIAGASFIASRPGVRAAVLRSLRHLPRVGTRLYLFQLTRMYRTLGMLLHGGMPIVPALGMVRGLMDPALWPQFDAATRRIREGMPISTALIDGGLTTAVAARMLRVGEQTGDMGAMMERIAALYDEDNARALDMFSRTFEPLLMAMIGLIIGSIVVLMYLPIFELAAGIQ